MLVARLDVRGMTKAAAPRSAEYSGYANWLG